MIVTLQKMWRSDSIEVYLSFDIKYAYVVQSKDSQVINGKFGKKPMSIHVSVRDDCVPIRVTVAYCDGN